MQRASQKETAHCEERRETRARCHIRLWGP